MRQAGQNARDLDATLKMFPLAATSMAIAGAATLSRAIVRSVLTDAVFGAKISISQAIAAAEQATGGKAYSARIDNVNGVVAYEVKTAKTGALEMVSVDINAGNVVKVTPIDAKADDNEQSD
jgi:uncharacterized membrane protein YkoI